MPSPYLIYKVCGRMNYSGSCARMSLFTRME